MLTLSCETLRTTKPNRHSVLHASASVHSITLLRAVSKTGIHNVRERSYECWGRDVRILEVRAGEFMKAYAPLSQPTGQYEVNAVSFLL